jgi:uncharacterized membrane protein YgcG
MGAAAAAISPADVAATLSKQLVNAINAFPASAAAYSIEAQLALIIEQSGASSEAVVTAINLAETAPGASANARQALQELKQLIVSGKHRNRIGAVGSGQGAGSSLGSAGPGFVGGGGSSDYHN